MTEPVSIAHRSDRDDCWHSGPMLSWPRCWLLAAVFSVLTLASSPVAAEICDKGEEIRVFSAFVYWSLGAVLVGIMLFRRSKLAACLLAIGLAFPLIATMFEGDIDSDLIVQGMIREGCRLPRGDEIGQSLILAACAPLAAALPFIADRFWPRKEMSR